ncbi:type II toxin-antitoxin system PemK/MazF family toxin [Candidatus Bipolaricaulota bacterium]
MSHSASPDSARLRGECTNRLAWIDLLTGLRFRRTKYESPAAAPEGGLTKRSFVKCEETHCISKDRLVEHIGDLAAPTMEEVSDRLRILLSL